MNSNFGDPVTMDLSQKESGLSRPRILFLGLSFLSMAACAYGGVVHYLKWHWGNPAHLVGWLLSMLFLLLAFSPRPRQVAASLKSALSPKTAFFVFWVLVFTVSHLWHFSTAPWNGNSLFDESGWDLYFLKNSVIGHPYQAAWFHIAIARETLFHYYLWPFFWLFGFNILSYEAGLFVIWCTTFLFTLLLVDLLFRSNIVTATVALIFNFLPFAFIYTFAGYRYPMAIAWCVASLYFLHRGFGTPSSFYLSLGGITAGLCLASSISGKQYLLVLVLFALLYAGLHWKALKRRATWSSVSLVVYGCFAAVIPILCYIVFNREDYTRYEAAFVDMFRQALTGHHTTSLTDMSTYVRQLRECFFSLHARFFIPDVLPIPLPYYWLLLPGLVLALCRKRYEIALLAVVPVVGAFVAGCFENRLLLAIPFWIILMAFTLDFLLKLRLRPSFKIPLLGMAAVMVIAGLIPSIHYIDKKTKDPFAIHYFAQQEVAVSRFMKEVVAGKRPSNPPRLERDEFNRIEGIPTVPYETFICQEPAFSIIHLFLHDYDDKKILSYCADHGFAVMGEREIWSANKKAIAGYVSSGKDLKLIWERHPKTYRIIKVFEQFCDFGSEESLSYSFGGKETKFYVLNIGCENIRQFQERVRTLPDTLF
jgi:hypothetical protein